MNLTKIDWYSVKTKVVGLVLLYFLMRIVSGLPYFNYISSALYLAAVLFIASIWATTAIPWWRLILYCIGIEAVRQVLLLAIWVIPTDEVRIFYLILDELTICMHLFLQYLLLRKLYGWKKISLKKKNIVLLAVYLTCWAAYFVFSYWYNGWLDNRSDAWFSQGGNNVWEFFDMLSYDPFGELLAFCSILVANMRMLFFSIIQRNSNIPREEAVTP